jgi:hypothetical protein
MIKRVFLVDYQDKNGNDLWSEQIFVGDNRDCNIGDLVNDFKAQGFRVIVIHEILGGYSAEQNRKMNEVNPEEAKKYLKCVYSKLTLYPPEHRN